MSAMVVAPIGKLGKKAVKYDRRTIAISPYIQRRKLPKIPLTHTLSKRTLATFPDLGMMGNDRYSDCTCAALGHMEQTWSVYGDKPTRPTDSEILAAYSLINGGVDEGAAMLDALKMARNVGIGGRKIYGFVQVNPLDHDQVRTATFLFGGLYLGANLPISVRSQETWDTGEGAEFSPGSLGGHAMSLIDYAAKSVQLVTWGRVQRVTWAWIDRYVDECYGVLSAEYVGDDNRSPQGFSLAKLAADLKGLR